MFGMQQVSKVLQLKSKGFMLAEAMFSLFITMMALLILQNLLLSIRKANLDQSQHVNEVAYAYVQLENFMRAEKIRAVYPVTRLATRSCAYFKCVDQEDDETTYRIEHYKKDVLKVSSSGKGYMPLLFNIEDAKFKTTKDSIIIRVTEKNKGKSDLVFKLDEEQEKKNVKTKKEKTSRQS